MSSPIKILLVEDSAVMRILLKDIINSCPELKLIGTANDGNKGVEQNRLLSPDAIISDLIMPNCDGVELVKKVMSSQPTPIIMLSSLDRNSEMVFDALNAGAFDFMEKPTDNIIDTKEIISEKLVSLLQAATKSKLAGLNASRIRGNQNSHTFSGSLNYNIIAIGASTGGPGALEKIIQQIPTNLSIPIVIAQHMPHNFIESFTRRLNKISPLPVVLMKDQTPIIGGNIYIAPGNTNIEIKNTLRGNIAVYSSKVYEDFNKPSINCLFDSVADCYGRKAIGVVLTGMGKDGGEGLKNIKNRGGLTLSQDKNSSVVYGMPKYAEEINASDYQMNIKDIAGFIISSLN